MGVAIPVGLSVLVVKFAPEWLAASDRLDPAEKAEEIGRVRTALIAVLAGAIATIGAVYTARSYTLNRQGQITERFTRAVEQLGHAKREVRMGGIYALERIARDSPIDHGPIMEVLTAYLREHARWRGATEATSPTEEPEPPSPAPDVQAALTVLGRRDPDHDDRRTELRLSRLDLRGSSLRGGRFENARFRDAHLEWCKLEGAHLEGAKMRGAHLQGADLQDAPDLNLPAAHLGGATLAGASYDASTRWPRSFDPTAAGCRRVDEHSAPDK